MSVSHFPLHSCEVAVREHKRTTIAMAISIASYSPGNGNRASVAVSQMMDNLRLKIDVPRADKWSGVCHVELSRTVAEELCKDLAERLGFTISKEIV